MVLATLAHMRKLKGLLLVIGLFIAVSSQAQYSTLREQQLMSDSLVFALDTLSIYPGSMDCRCGNQVLTSEDYTIDFAAAKLYLKTPCSDSLSIRYRVLPIRFPSSLLPVIQVLSTQHEKAIAKNF